MGKRSQEKRWTGRHKQPEGLGTWGGGRKGQVWAGGRENVGGRAHRRAGMEGNAGHPTLLHPIRTPPCLPPLSPTCWSASS